MKCAVIVGGMDMMAQSLMLAKKPHIIIATPGRLVDHLENTKGFSLRNLKILVSTSILLCNIEFCLLFITFHRLWTKLIEF